MSKGLNNYPNITAPDSDYPDGSLRDKTLSLPGTPVNKEVYDDMHQTLAKFLRLATITANGLPDNESNGFQYVKAMRYMMGPNRRVLTKQGAAVSTSAEANYAAVIVCDEDCQSGHTVSMEVPTGGNTGKVMIANYSQNTIDVYDQAGTNNIDGAPAPYTLAIGKCVEFHYSSGTTNWVIDTIYDLDSF